MPLGEYAAANPNKIATIMAGSGESLTFGELNSRSIRLARLFQAHGLREGDVVALFMENNIRYHEVYWAVVRMGMYVCAVNKYLTADEAAYIFSDSGCKALVTSAALGGVAKDVPGGGLRLVIDGDLEGYARYETMLEGFDDTPLDAEPMGDFIN